MRKYTQKNILHIILLILIILLTIAIIRDLSNYSINEYVNDKECYKLKNKDTYLKCSVSSDFSPIILQKLIYGGQHEQFIQLFKYHYDDC